MPYKIFTNNTLSKDYLHEIIENLTDLIFVIEANGIIKFVSPAIKSVLGYEPEEVLGTNIFRFLHPDEIENTKKKYKELLANPTKTQSVFLRVFNKDGSIRYINGNRKNLLDNKEIQGIILTVKDVTENFKFEQENKKTKELLSSVEHFSKAGGWQWDLKNQIMTWTDETFNIHGMIPYFHENDSISLISKSISCYSDEDKEKITQAFNNCIANGTPYELECKFKPINGDYIWIRTRAKAVYENGKIVKIFGNIANITVEKKYKLLDEARLKLIQFSYNSTLDEFLQKFLDEAETLSESKIGFYHFVNENQESLNLQIWSTNTLKTMCTAEGRGTHYNISEAGVWVECFYSGKPVIHNDYEKLPNKKGMPEGHAKVTRELTVPLIRNKKVVAILGVGNKETNYDDFDVNIITQFADLAWDITERKRTEIALKNSENRFRGLAEFSPLAIFETDADGNCFYVNKKWCEFAGIPKENAFGNGWLNGVYHEDRNYVSELWRNKCSVDNNCSFEYRFCTPEGKITWVLGSVVSVKNIDDKIIGFIGANADISIRKDAENLIEEQRKHLETLFENSPIAIWEEDFTQIKQKFDLLKEKGIVDLGGYLDKNPNELLEFAKAIKVNNINWESVKLFGGSSKEEIIDNLPNYLVNQNNNSFKEELASLWNGITEFESEYKVTKVNGEKITVFLKLNVLPGYEKTLGKVLVSLIDISKQKNAELELEKNQKIEIIRNKELAQKNLDLIEARKSALNVIEDLYEEIEESRRKEIALRNSELRFQQVSENALEWIWEVDKKGLYTYSSSVVKQLLGYEPEEIVNKKYFYDLLKPDEQSGIKEIALSFFKRKESFKNIINTNIDKNGNEVIFSTSGIPILSDKGDLIGYRGLDIDITDQVRAEQIIINSNLRYKTLFSQAADGIITLTIDGFIKSANESFSKMVGYSIDELKTMNIRDLSIENIDELYPERLEKLAAGETVKFEERHRCKDGKIIPFEATVSQVKIGDEIFIQAFHRDISERKIAEEALQESEQKFRTIFEKHSAAILLLDSETGAIIDANKAAEKFYGWSIDKLKTMKISQINTLSEDEVKKAVENVKNGVESHFIFNHRLANGEIRDVEVFSSAVNFGNNKFLHSIIHDITDRKKAEKALKNSEELYRNLFENSPLGILHFNNDSIITKVNEEFAKIIGTQKEKLVGLNIVKQLKDKKLISAVYETLTNGLGYYKGVYTSILGNKTTPVIINFGAIYDTNNKIIGGIGIVEDITNQKAAEEELRKSEERFMRLSEVTYEGIIIHSRGAAIDVNTSFTKLFGYLANELKGENALEMLVDKNYLDFVKTNFQNDIVVPYEILAKRKDGSTFFAEIETKNIIGKDGSVRVTAVRDITIRKQNEQEIRILSDVVKQTPTSVVITDIDGNIEYVNDFFTKITGYSFSEVFGKNPRILKTDYLSSTVYKELWKTILNGETWHGEFQNKKKDGELYWEDSIISPIKDSSGKIINFFALKTDITEKKKIEAELAEYRENLEKIVISRTTELSVLNQELISQLEKGKELEVQLAEALSKEKEINELKTKFIATVSHEFRTPLAALFSSTQMVQRYAKKWSEEQLDNQYLRIDSTIKYLTQLLDDVLTISRADREILTNNPEPLNVESFIQLVFEQLKLNITDSHNLVFTNNISEKIIFVDKKLINHILTNLLTNAIKYSPNGGKVELKLSNEDNNIKIEVSDTGLGIPEDEMKYIFDAFYRTKNSVGINGSGLGLNITKRAIEVLNGNITVNSKINEGTTFIINIPTTTQLKN